MMIKSDDVEAWWCSMRYSRENGKAHHSFQRVDSGEGLATSRIVLRWQCWTFFVWLTGGLREEDEQINGKELRSVP